MKYPRCLPSILVTLLIIICLYTSGSAQTPDDKNTFAALRAAGASVRWEVSAAHSGMTVTIAAPDGRIFRKEIKSGGTAEFTLSDKEGNRLPDGQYSYELRLTPIMSAALKAELAAARGKDDDPEAIRAARKRVTPAALVQSGGFSIVNGAVVVAGASEEPGQRRVSKTSGSSLESTGPAVTVKATNKNPSHHPLRIVTPDDVIPDDLIVQGSACVGLDCVNGEVFGFDTIRLKENNTRIQFDDTSAAGFPTNNWQIRANSSAGGSSNFLAFVDQGATGNSETGTILFEVDAGAPANSLRVSSTGRVGLRTGTPALDLQITTSDTPAHRLEQTNAGGFTAQTWDIAGNEANFFVRDVTGGSRLPFRIRPGAPTSSVDISASGNVGIGTASPTAKLDVAGVLALTGNAFANGPSISNSNDGLLLVGGATLGVRINNQTNGAELMRVTNAGLVGIGTAAPTDTLSVNGTASKPGGGSWAVFSDERLKNIKGNFSSGLGAVMRLQPLRYEYKPTNDLKLDAREEHIGFSAQALQKVIPEAVVTSSNGYLMVNNDPILWTMLNAIKEQQKQIEQLKGEVRQLRAASRKRR